MTIPEDRRGLDRRSLLAGLGALGAAAVVGTGGGTAFADEAGTTGVTPMDLRFRITEQFRPFGLLAPGFEQYDTAAPPMPRASGDFLVRTGVSPRAPFATVLVEVTELGAGASVVAGLAANSANRVLARYDAAKGQASIEVTVNGTTTTVRSAAASLRAPFRFAFVVNENAVTALADTTGTGTGWAPLVTERDGVSARIDLRRPATLGTLSYAYGAGGDGPVVLGRVQAGYYGQAGLRDLHAVQYADGRPLIRDGKLYLTATCAGLGFFQQAHWGVWTLDLAQPSRLTQVAQLYFSRDGVITGDHAGQIVLDGDSYIVAMSSWGDFAFKGVHIRHTRTRANVLQGVHVLPTERLNLPTTVSSWDPSLTKIDGRWHIGFVESPSQTPFNFHPALAVAPRGADYTQGLALRGRDATMVECEGTILQRVGGRWYLLASDGIGRQYRVYDLDMRFQGTLDAPYKTNIPHPQIVPVGKKWLLVTFDGTQYAEPVLGYGGHGDVIIMTA
ncbi:hypothetical protein JOF53_006278 [Crossiella equi]|uniref:Uncharacterized protein n=1 Tax=Crossiella equi TaxID=130796 RepID=A0ABS5ALH0_9PSEU|nr:hypothetical protein [Crossiella equi]MBP2477406.1 hypothetical protein [Crossiella equi]